MLDLKGAYVSIKSITQVKIAVLLFETLLFEIEIDGNIII